MIMSRDCAGPQTRRRVRRVGHMLPFALVNSLCKTTMSFRFNCYYPAEKLRFFVVDLDQNYIL